MARVAHDGLAPTLAEYMLSLSGGNRCFCCGKPLQAKESGGSVESASVGLQRLICTNCGSEVADVLGWSAVRPEELRTFTGAQRTAA